MYYDDYWQWHSFEKHVSFNMLKYHIIILLQQFTKPFKQFFKLSSNLCRAKWAIEWIKGVVRYTFKYCFNKWKLYPKKKKEACRLKTTVHEQITFSGCHYQCNSYSGNLFLNSHMLSGFATLEINKLAVVGKRLTFWFSLASMVK